MDSPYAVLGGLIVLFGVLDLMLAVGYFGNLALRRRRNSLYRRQYHPQQRHHHHHHRPYGIGRIGTYDDENEQVAYQRLGPKKTEILT